MIALGFWIGAMLFGPLGVVVGMLLGIEFARRKPRKRADIKPALAKAHWIRRKRS